MYFHFRDKQMCTLRYWHDLKTQEFVFPKSYPFFCITINYRAILYQYLTDTSACNKKNIQVLHVLNLQVLTRMRGNGPCKFFITVFSLLPKICQKSKAFPFKYYSNYALLYLNCDFCSSLTTTVKAISETT